MTASEMPPEPRPGELSVRKKAVTIHTFPDGGGVHVTKTRANILALGQDAKEKRDRQRQLREEAQAAVAQAALEGTEPTVVELARAYGNVETYPDGSTAVTIPITGKPTYSVHPPVLNPRNEGNA